VARRLCLKAVPREPVVALRQTAHRHHPADLRLALAGIGAFFVLPVAPLPQVDFP
jgi:hypothetical protein